MLTDLTNAGEASFDCADATIVAQALSEPLESDIARAAERLGRCCGAEFLLFDCETGEPFGEVDDLFPRDWSDRVDICCELIRKQQAAIIEEESPVALLAVPLFTKCGSEVIALAPFLTTEVESLTEVAAAAEWFDLDEEQVYSWTQRQTVRDIDALVETAQLLVDQQIATQEVTQLRSEINQVSSNIASTYEEISLLHRLAQNLKISHGDVELGRLALEWLSEVAPAMGLTIWFDHRNPLGQSHASKLTESVVVREGFCSIDDDQFESVLACLGGDVRQGPVVVNEDVTSKPDWPFPQIRQLVCVPLAEGERIFGYLLATNHKDGLEFGTVEASLLNSVSSILGIHSGNVLLYREQAEFLSQMVHALTSAIDAKDPYTCGHSDRVARVAVRIGQELGCDAKALNTLYLGGLLHDIGKIGIEDQVLRKPGKLTAEEYEHIKEHPELGHNILSNVSRLDEVLPIVLHHHESWDGAGYPHGLVGEETPLNARIAAVADAFDAMSSDRPYRPGMTDEKLDKIIREGAGQQWDTAVVEAFFAAREDIREIAAEERSELSLDIERWS